MKAYWKIPKEWVQNWGLSGLEAILLADIKSWDKPCTLDERAVRCGMSKNGVRKALENIAKKVPQSSTDEVPQSVLSKVHKVARKKYTKCTNESTQSVQKVPQSSTKLKEKKEISPTPPIKNKKEECNKKNIEEHYLSDATAPTGKNEEQKVYSLQHRCRLFFEQIYSQKKGAEYWYEGKDAAALKNILKKIRFLMPDEEKDNEEKLEYNFQYFVNAICTSPHTSAWVMDNFSLPTINSKFNEIYSQLKNGTAKQYRQQSGITDDQIRSIAERVAENGGLAF